MSRRTEVSLLAAAFSAAVIGMLVYLLDRQPDSVYFLTDGLSLKEGLLPVFGSIGYHLPTFIHVYVFILLTVVVTSQGIREVIPICLAWLTVDSVFEVAQAVPFAQWLAVHMPAEFSGIPFLENTANYFLTGTFDVLDLVSIVMGAVAAYLTVMACVSRTTYHHKVNRQPENTLRSYQVILVVLLAFVGTVGSVQSSSSGGGDQDYSIAWLTVNAIPVYADAGDTAHVSLDGEAFVSPDYVAERCGGMACWFTWYDDSYPGVNVTWQNLATGASGSALSRYGTLTSFEHLWSAYVSVIPGANQLDITASDPAGNIATKSITVVVGPDIMPPVVIATTPVDGAAYVNLYDPVTAWFSESIDPATVNENSFMINAYGGDPVNGSVSVSESGTRVTFVPMNLGTNTNYTVTLTTDITDIFGKPLNENYVWTFSTGEGDFEAPTVTSTEPQDESVDVSLFKGISASFSEPMDHSTITTGTFTVLDAAYNNVDGSVSISSSGSADTAIFTPDNPLQPTSLYTATIVAGVADLAGNTLQNDYTWNFTTMPSDTTPPAVESVDPLDGETCVALDKSVTVTFDEEMDASTLNTSTFLLTDPDNNPISGQVSNTSTSSIFIPYTNLSYGTDYRATLNTGVKDLSGNSLSSDYSWTYTTVTTSKGNWTPMSTADVPSGRTHHTAVWSGSEMIVWGGGWNGVSNTGGRYHLLSDSWQPTNTTGAPSPRMDHTAVWTGDEMIVWGGYDGNQTWYNSGGRYDPLTNSWQASSVNGAPSPRRYHITIWTGSEMIFWGGSDGTQSLNNGARYNPSTDTWYPMSTTDAPQYHYGFDWGKAVWTGNEMILLNRYNFNPGNGGRYDPVTDRWHPISPNGAPPYGVEIETLVWTGTEVFVWGGNYFSAYNPLTDSWRQLPRSCSPTSRLYSEGIWTGNEMIIWGGYIASSLLDTGGLYHPASNLWSSTSLINAPSPRSNHTAIWTGNEMVIWGGDYGVDAGGKYTP